MERKAQAGRGEDRARKKRPYSAPVVREYGRIEQLTLSLLVSGNDGSSNANRMRVS